MRMDTQPRVVGSVVGSRGAFCRDRRSSPDGARPDGLAHVALLDICLLCCEYEGWRGCPRMFVCYCARAVGGGGGEARRADFFGTRVQLFAI